MYLLLLLLLLRLLRVLRYASYYGAVAPGPLLWLFNLGVNITMTAGWTIRSMEYFVLRGARRPGSST